MRSRTAIATLCFWAFSPVIAAAQGSPETPASPAQQPIRYRISFDNAVHHEARVDVTFPELRADTLAVVMSRSSPGRYAVHDFAKNVYDVSAVDGRGRMLQAARATPHEWRIAGHDGTVTFRYTLFADRADGTYSGIDATHAHLNMPATFAFGRGLADRPITVTFHPPAGAGWQVATQLVPTDDPTTFTAPDLQYFLDSPTEISDFELREWQVESRGEAYTIRLALHHDGTAAEADEYADRVARVVDEETAIFGELPDFDQGTYTFLADYLPHVFGDGMEHRNSTTLTSQRPLSTGALANLGTVAHE
ncbi:MAG: M61 family metallopeptidase, partial [Longimicrobiales bacterium]